MSKARTLDVIADEIYEDYISRGKDVYYAAKPYVDAMRFLGTVDDYYGADSGDYIVRYALSNLTTWRGETARRVKAELKGMLK